MRRTHLTHTQEERRRAENRRKECLIEDHQRTLNKDQMLRANMTSDERVQNKRFLRRLHQETQEIEQDRRIIEVRFWGILTIRLYGPWKGTRY